MTGIVASRHLVTGFERPLHIAMVLPSLVRAGMEVVTARLAMELAQVGHSVNVACLEESGPLADELTATGIPVRVIHTPGLLTNLVPRRLSEWLAQTKPDIVHSHSGVWLKAARAAHMARVPGVVHTVHGLLTDEPWYTPTLMRVAARFTSAVVAVSSPLRGYLIDTARVPDRMVRTVPNGVDTSVFSPSVCAARDEIIGRKVSGLVVGCVARFDPIKNHELLLEAFAVVRRVHPTATLVLVGHGELREALEHRSRQPDLAGSVVFVGERHDTADLYRCFDAVVLTSKAEGTSISLLEAMASGCCIVATDVGGTGALLDRGGAGILVKPGNPSAFGEQLIAVLSDNEKRRRFGEAARARAVHTYSQRAMAIQYLSIYDSVLGRTSPGGSAVRVEATGAPAVRKVSAVEGLDAPSLVIGGTSI